MSLHRDWNNYTMVPVSLKQPWKIIYVKDCEVTLKDIGKIGQFSTSMKRHKAQIPSIIRGMSWWRHQMDTFSALLAICAGNSPVRGEFHAQRPATPSFYVFFDLRPNKRLSKQSWGWWSETPSRSLWRHFNVPPLNDQGLYFTFYYFGLTLNPACISKYTHYEVRGEITYSKLQRCNRWSLWKDKDFKPTFYWAWNYLSMLGPGDRRLGTRQMYAIHYLYP